MDREGGRAIEPGARQAGVGATLVGDPLFVE